ncbi:lipocalin family protein [Subsaxibacter sp. CAU 1640]|uniref:lipocalin family protein n=1 Tax=Subsaxibacter sp. CAU 1640 TaxID=2933271 RepID=UPI0020038EB9|nr:lipocalin family protein [Subsaxibacter sp. CAU 1640]MCK7589315.1 lipocalin family protein [Subsaxibacter sp. CAU 1640]
MKRLFLLFALFGLLLTSCSNDDDSSQDRIVGTWTYHKAFENGVEIVLSDCEKQETYIFRSDNTVDYKYYEEDMSSNCLLEEDISGTWSVADGNIYTLDFGFGSASQALTFEDDTFFYDDTFEDFTYRDVYIRN